MRCQVCEFWGRGRRDGALMEITGPWGLSFFLPSHCEREQEVALPGALRTLRKRSILYLAIETVGTQRQQP